MNDGYMLPSDALELRPVSNTVKRYQKAEASAMLQVETLERKIQFEEELAMKKFTIIADDMYEV